MKKYFCSILIYSLCLSALCLAKNKVTEEEVGSISGNIVDAKTNEPLIGVNVILDGTTIGASTDIDGTFKIKNLKKGTYTLNCTYISYKTKKIEKVEVNNGKTTTVNIQLEENVAELNAVNITANKVTNTDGAVVNEVKKSEQVVNGVSADQISKAQDKDASEVIKRVPGVTIVGNRFVMIRGLSERYNSVLLNNSVTPSFEADTRAFSFDVIPSQHIDRLLIYKTASPELPGDFAGGAIKVFTKNIPDENNFSIGYGTGFLSGTTNKDFYKYEGGKKDWLGVDDGTRNLSSDFPAHLKEIKDTNAINQLGKSLSNNWTIHSSKAMPDQKLSLNFARKFSIRKIQIGNITSINYITSKNYFDIHRLDFNSIDEKTGKSDTIFDYHDNQYTQNISTGIIHNWSVKLNNQHKIEFRNFFNQIGKIQTTVREGKNFEAGNEVRAYEYSFLSRKIYSGQLSTIHDFFNEKTHLELTFGYSKANRNEPDRRRIRYVRNLDINTDEGDDPRYYALLSTTASLNDAGRFFSELNEEIQTGGINVEQKIKIKNFEPKIKAGFYYEKKERAFSARVLGYAMAKSSKFNWDISYQPLDSIFREENINSYWGLQLKEITNPSDAYTASNEQIASYLAFSLPLTKKINVNTGARIENNQQILNSFSQFNGNKEVTVNNLKTDVLPSLNATYNFTEKSLVRIAYGITLNRPEFRELAPFAFYDFDFNGTVYGNDSLKNATIYNYDARYEFYPAPSEMISVGIFYKKFDNPIESIIIPGSGSVSRTYSFSNADFATSLGAEVEIRKSLQFLKIKPLSNFGVMLNGALIKSKVDLGAKAVAQSNERAMQGQSPYVVNGGIFYKVDSLKLQVNVLYNVIGPRIVLVGSVGYPDIVEMPRNQLDISVGKMFGKHLEIKFAVKDLLNQSVLYIQDSNEDGKYKRNRSDQQIMSYKRGSIFTLGVNWKF